MSEALPEENPILRECEEGKARLSLLIQNQELLILRLENSLKKENTQSESWARSEN
jgi:hypothetical protein